MFAHFVSSSIYVRSVGVMRGEKEIPMKKKHVLSRCMMKFLTLLLIDFFPDYYENERIHRPIFGPFYSKF